jgi:xylono-1,5-lactonase
MPTELVTDVVLRHTAGKGLLEAPRYDDALGLVFSDARQGGIHRLADDGSVDTLVHHRRGIGGIALHERGGFVVGGRNVAYKRDDETPTVELLGQDPDVRRNGFNDLTTDARGRVYVGSLGEVAIDNDKNPGRVPGGIELLDLDGSSRRVADGISLVNGMGLSTDGRRLYVSDSLRPAVLAYDVDPETGDLGPETTFFAFDEGAPDGLALSDDGLVWVALARTGTVVALAPDGTVAARLEVPVPLVTSVAFGGPDRATLFITTGAEGDDDPADAAVYAAAVPYRGLPVPPARVPVDGR